MKTFRTFLRICFVVATSIYPVVAYPVFGSFGWHKGTRVPREIVETLKGHVQEVTVMEVVRMTDELTQRSVEFLDPIFQVVYDRNGTLLSSKSPLDSMCFVSAPTEVENVYGKDGRLNRKRTITPEGILLSTEEMTYTEEGLLSTSTVRSSDNELRASTSYNHDGLPRWSITYLLPSVFFQKECQRDSFGDITMLSETSSIIPPRVTLRTYTRDQYGNWISCDETVKSQDDKGNVTMKQTVYYREIKYFN